MIWSKCSKETFQSKNKLEIAVIMVVSKFNMSCENTARLKIFVRGDAITVASRKISLVRDSERLKRFKEKIQHLHCILNIIT